MGTGIDYVEITFDRPRRLRYRIRDLRDLCSALGNITLVELLGRLAGLDPNALTHAVRFALVHEDPRLPPARVDDLIEAHIASHGDVTRLIAAISDALQATGLISRRADGAGAGEAAGGAASTP